MFPREIRTDSSRDRRDLHLVGRDSANFAARFTHIVRSCSDSMPARFHECPALHDPTVHVSRLRVRFQRSPERASFWTVRRPQHVGGQDWASSARASLDERARSRRQGRERRDHAETAGGRLGPPIPCRCVHMAERRTVTADRPGQGGGGRLADRPVGSRSHQCSQFVLSVFYWSGSWNVGEGSQPRADRNPGCTTSLARSVRRMVSSLVRL